MVAVLAVGALCVAVPHGLVGVANAMSASTAKSISDDAGITISNYTDPSIDGPDAIVSGPDGALWFTNNYNSSIGRITTGGSVSNFAPGLWDNPDGIAVGPDGALWISSEACCFGSSPGDSLIGRLTTGGEATTFVGGQQETDITTGPDGALWFTDADTDSSIGRITTSGVVTQYTDPTIDFPHSITTGPDGALWFTNSNNSIGRITTDGVVTNYTDPSIDAPQGITTGPDGALWFTNGYGNSIGRITTAGVITNYTDPSIDFPQDITTGPDGALWFTNVFNNSIGRITTAGVVTNYTDPSIDTPQDLTTGPDGALWFTNQGNNSIGRLALSPTAPTISGGPPSPVNTNNPDDFSFSLTGVPPPTTTVTSGALPLGLTLSTDGTITGAPTVAGTYTATVTAANGVEPDATDTFTIVVSGVPPTISGAPPSDVSPGAPYSFSLALAGTPPPTTSVTSGSLPPGLALSTGGVISGSPNMPGSYTATVTATNGITPDASETFTIVVLGAPTISGAPPSPVDASEPYNFAFTLSGGPAPTTSVTSGSLPAGLTLSSDGVIGGTPITAGSYSATVTAANGIGPAATENINITVDPVLTVSPQSGLPGASVDVNGAGFEPGETVDVAYDAPAPTDLCSASAVPSDGTFTCTGDIPPAPGAGKKGIHAISATGMTSRINATANFTLVTKSPTLRVKPSANLIGNRSVLISGKNWPAGDDIQVYQCAEDPTTDPGSCIDAEDEVASPSGTWSVAYEPVVGQIENACAAECYIEATSGSTDLVSTLTFKTPSVEIKGQISDGIYLGQKVSIAVKNFPAGDPVTIEICSFSDCDPSTEASETLGQGGNATFRGYFMNTSVCASGGEDCYILAQDSVSNGPVAATEGFNAYCGPICGGFTTKR